MLLLAACRIADAYAWGRYFFMDKGYDVQSLEPTNTPTPLSPVSRFESAPSLSRDLE
jgi:hypothetical protein